MFNVGPNVKIQGFVQTSEPTHVEGVVDGMIVAPRIEVAIGGTVEGDISGEQVLVFGRVSGDVYADKLTLKSGCYVEGAIFHKELVLESGAIFEGKSRRYPEPRKLAPVVEMGTGDHAES